MIFTKNDIVGRWLGTVSNSEKTLKLTITVDNFGKVSGSGVNSTWDINSSGKVVGNGSFSFIDDSHLTVASATWSLRLNKDKNTLTGKFNARHPTLHDMDVNLTKE